MPELPEVEHLRRSVDPWLCGAEITAVEVRRADVVCVANLDARTPASQHAPTPLDLPQLLGRGSSVLATDRHGKQMAMRLSSGFILIVQLGMTGTLRLERTDQPLDHTESKHRHVVWTLRRGSHAAAPKTALQDRWRLSFRDPRRFGGITVLDSNEALSKRWSVLGPDALSVGGAALAAALSSTKRPIKAALLDQGVLAGIGNIYADEALFRAGIHPLRAANALQRREASTLARHIRAILAKAVVQGGSTLRDYRDAFGASGSARQSHAVYGRGGQPCLVCEETLGQITVAARTTVFCPRCQP